jgi:hypothetical protein
MKRLYDPSLRGSTDPWWIVEAPPDPPELPLDGDASADAVETADVEKRAPNLVGQDPSGPASKPSSAATNVETAQVGEKSL